MLTKLRKLAFSTIELSAMLFFLLAISRQDFEGWRYWFVLIFGNLMPVVWLCLLALRAIQIMADVARKARDNG